MKQLFQKSNALAALAYFLENPYGEAYLREISRKTGISPPTLSRMLFLLRKDGLVLKRSERNATFFKADMNPFFKSLKVAYTLSKIHEKKVVELIRGRSSGLGSILLYGSAARGEDGQGSDYDFLVVAASCEANAADLAPLLKRECSLKALTLSQWKDASRKNRAFYLEVLSGSVALHGNVPVID